MIVFASQSCCDVVYDLPTVAVYYIYMYLCNYTDRCNKLLPSSYCIISLYTIKIAF